MLHIAVFYSFQNCVGSGKYIVTKMLYSDLLTLKKVSYFKRKNIISIVNNSESYRKSYNLYIQINY